MVEREPDRRVEDVAIEIVFKTCPQSHQHEHAQWVVDGNVTIVIDERGVHSSATLSVVAA